MALEYVEEWTGLGPCLNSSGALCSNVSGSASGAFELQVTPYTLPTADCRLQTAHCTLHTAHYTLHTTHCTPRTSHTKLHTTHLTLHTTHYTLGVFEFVGRALLEYVWVGVGRIRAAGFSLPHQDHHRALFLL